MNGTKLSTLHKNENQSSWMRDQPKFTQFTYECPNDPWEEEKKMYKTKIKGMPLDILRTHSNRERNNMINTMNIIKFQNSKTF